MADDAELTDPFPSGTAIWGFASNGCTWAILRSSAQLTHLFRISVAANTARDVGGRLAAIAIWGTRASGGKYAALAALTNILATVVAYSFYEFILKDSSRGTLHMIIIYPFLSDLNHCVVPSPHHYRKGMPR
jgi:hypothetical protein